MTDEDPQRAHEPSAGEATAAAGLGPKEPTPGLHDPSHADAPSDATVDVDEQGEESFPASDPPANY